MSPPRAANSSGVKPVRVRKSTSAPCATSSRTLSRCPSPIAHIRAEWPVLPTVALTAAPRASSVSTMLASPVRAAIMSGVRPLAWARSGFAPPAAARSTIAGLAFSHASASGVTPRLLAAVRVGARLEQKVGQLQVVPVAAHCSAVAPSGRRASTSAPASSSARTDSVFCCAAASTSRVSAAPAAATPDAASSPTMHRPLKMCLMLLIARLPPRAASGTAGCSLCPIPATTSGSRRRQCRARSAAPPAHHGGPRRVRLRK